MKKKLLGLLNVTHRTKSRGYDEQPQVTAALTEAV